MILPRRTVYCLLLALSATGILFRYPLGISHELGADTTFIHSLADGIVQDGRGLWIEHPFSYFGLYALSYPSAVPFLLAAGSLVTGVTVEGFTLILGWIVTLAGAWGAFLAARSIRRDDVFALLVATIFSLAPFVVKDTFWVAQSRGFVVTLLPVFLLVLIRSMRTYGIPDIVLAIAFFVVFSTIHRMGFLTFFFLAAFLFALPFHKLSQGLRFALSKYERPARFALAGTAVFGFVGMFYIQFMFPGIGGADVVDQYSTGALLQGSSFPTLVANMGISLTGKIGPLFPLAPLGIAALLWRRPKEVVDKFLLTATLLFLPLLSLRDYITEFLIPLFAILVVVGLMWLGTRTKRRGIVMALLVCLVAGSLVFSWGMKDYWHDHRATDAPISSSAYATSLYIQRSATGTIVANNGLMAGQIAAMSGMPVLPIGGASQHWTGPQQLMWGFVELGGAHITLLPINKISFNTDEIYVADGVPNSEVDWETMLYYSQPGPADQLFRQYGVHYLVVDMQYPHTFESYGLERSSNYLGYVLQDTSYLTYDNGGFELWYRG